MPKHARPYLSPETYVLAQDCVSVLGLASLDTLLIRLLTMQAALGETEGGRRILRKYHLEGTVK